MHKNFLYFITVVFTQIPTDIYTLKDMCRCVIMPGLNVSKNASERKTNHNSENNAINLWINYIKSICTHMNSHSYLLDRIIMHLFTQQFAIHQRGNTTMEIMKSTTSTRSRYSKK